MHFFTLLQVIEFKNIFNCDYSTMQRRFMKEYLEICTTLFVGYL
jgi:hypothetical protein